MNPVAACTARRRVVWMLLLIPLVLGPWAVLAAADQHRTSDEVKCSRQEAPWEDGHGAQANRPGEEERNLGVANPRDTTFTIIEHDPREIITPSPATEGDSEAADAPTTAPQTFGDANESPTLADTTSPPPASYPSATGGPTNTNTQPLPILPTNFERGTPFNFAHIFFLGGNCGNEDPWYRGFINAGMETLDHRPEIICPSGWNSTNPPSRLWWTRDFHLAALQMVEEIAGDKLNETLVITVGVGLELDWTPVADLLRKGMAFFHAKENPLDQRGFDLASHGFTDLNDILYLYFQWDEEEVARSNGKELCRLKGAKSPLKIATMDTAGRESAPQTYRFELALEAFQEACPDSEVRLLWSLYDNATRPEMESSLIFNPVPDVILTVSDVTAETILLVAQDVLSEAEYGSLTTTGWDNLYPELLRTHKLLITVDQLVHYPNIGIWKAISIIVKNSQKAGMNSTRAIQDMVGLGNKTTVKAEALTVSGDRAGYLISNLLEGYDPNFPPYEEVEVSTGLFGVTITEMNPFEGKFTAVLWLRVSWHDPRLGWHPIVYNDELPIDPANIWTPSLYFGNAFEHNELYTAPAMLTHDGTLITETNINAQFLCSTTENLRSFPFDRYNCSIDLGAPKGVSLDQNYGFHVIDTDPNYATTNSIDNPEGEESESHPANHQTVHYILIFERRPFTTYMRVILPGILINMIGFMAFWIPEVAESVVLGVTSLLCALAFRETVDMPETADITWSEIFMLVNIGYLAAVMFITWLSYSSSTRMGAKLNSLCLPCHPKKVAKDAHLLSSSVSMGHRDGHLDDKAAEVLRLEGALDRLRQEIEFDEELEANGSTEQAQDSYRNRRASNRQMPAVEDVLHFSNHGEEEIDLEQPPKSSKTKPRDPNWDSYRSADLDPSSMHKSLVGNDTYHARRRVSFPDFELPRARTSWEGGIGVSLANIMASLRNPLGKSKARDEEAASKPKVKHANGFDLSKDRSHANVDWIGRWFVVPSYFVVMATLLFGGWGFK